MVTWNIEEAENLHTPLTDINRTTAKVVEAIQDSLANFSPNFRDHVYKINVQQIYLSLVIERNVQERSAQRQTRRHSVERTYL